MAEERKPVWIGLISRQDEVVPRVWCSGDSGAMVLKVWDTMIKNYKRAGSQTTGIYLMF